MTTAIYISSLYSLYWSVFLTFKLIRVIFKGVEIKIALLWWHWVIVIYPLLPYLFNPLHPLPLKYSWGAELTDLHFALFLLKVLFTSSDTVWDTVFIFLLIIGLIFHLHNSCLNLTSSRIRCAQYLTPLDSHIISS